MNEPEEPYQTSMSLISNAVANDQQAWIKMTEVYGPLVYSWCRKFGLPPEDAADIFQDVFRSLSNNLEKFKKENEGDKFRAYLWTITRNKMRDLAKTNAPKAHASGGTDAFQMLNQVADVVPSESVVLNGSPVVQQAMESIRAEFEEKTWQMFWRVTIDDQVAAVVADEFDVKVASVYQAKSRVIRRLREELGNIPL